MTTEIQVLSDRSAVFVPMSLLEQFDEKEIGSQLRELVEEAQAAPRIIDAEKQTEIVDGKAEVKEVPGLRSSGIATRIAIEIGIYLKTNKIGRLYGSDATFTTVGGNERMADVAFVSNEKLKNGEPITKADFAPDLAIEVISPSDKQESVGKKINEYLAAGVRQVWRVEPDIETVTVYNSLTDVKIFTRNEIVTCEDILPGFQLSLSDVFID